MKGKIFNAQEEIKLKHNFKKEVYNWIIEGWENYSDMELMLGRAFEYAAFKFPEIALFSPNYSWQSLHDVIVRVSLKTNGINYKKPLLNSFIESILDERIKIFYKEPEEVQKTEQEIRDIAAFLYESFLKCEKKKLADSRLEKSGNNTVTLYSWCAVGSSIYLIKTNKNYYFGEISRDCDIGRMLISSDEIFSRIREKNEGLKRNYKKEVFESFIGYFFTELHGCCLNKNISKIKQLILTT